MLQRLRGAVRAFPAALAAGTLLLVLTFPAAAQPPPPANPAASEDHSVQPLQLVYSRWSKFCLNNQETNAKQACFTGRDGRTDSGTPIVAAVLIEPESDQKKVLRITLPLGMSIQPGTRVIVDNSQPMTGPYVICFNNGCMADYEANGELIGKLKKGEQLVIQGINGAGQPISLVVPLSGFAEAYDGPPTDPKVVEEPNSHRQPWLDDRILPSFRQQKRLQDELLRRRDYEQPRFPRMGAVN